MMDPLKNAAMGLAERTSRRGALERMSMALLGAVGANAISARSAHAASDPVGLVLDNVGKVQLAEINAENAAYNLTLDGRKYCLCWDDCHSCAPGRLAHIYCSPCNPDCKRNPNPTEFTRTVCTGRCCDAPAAC
jgi:hypothetical protein